MGKINASDKSRSKNQKKRKYGNKRNFFYIKLNLTDCSGMEFIAF